VRLLIVGADQSSRRALGRALPPAAYEVLESGPGTEALNRVSLDRPDAVLLDVGLSDTRGIETCRRLREGGSPLPILMLSVGDAPADRIAGLDAGADDFLSKPCDTGELLARLRALMRRVEDRPAEQRFGDLRLDVGRRRLIVGDRSTELTSMECRLLELLVRNPGRAVSHEVLHEHLWSDEPSRDSNRLSVYVGYVRRKLADAGTRAAIRTVHGVGYELQERPP
jgi:two-component system, OmpR family, response regulator MprA